MAHVSAEWIDLAIEDGHKLRALVLIHLGRGYREQDANYGWSVPITADVVRVLDENNDIVWPDHATQGFDVSE